MNDIINSSEIVFNILEQTQLEKFWPKIRDNLQISRLSHFNYVKVKDFEKIGISKPAARRLLEHVKKVQASLDESTRSTTRRSHSVNNVEKTPIKNDIYGNTPSFIINENDIQISNTILGTGNFGIVRKAIWKMPSGEKLSVAAKILHENILAESSISDLLSEISYMCNINHKNLIKLYGIVLSQSVSQQIIMVTELAPLGSLLNHLIINTNKILIHIMHSYFQQISYGLEYLESKKMIHRDLACRNLLLFSSDKIKICDFGMMRRVRDIDDTYMIDVNQKIPFPWYPPESIRKRVFSVKSDVWMFAMTLWELCMFGERPWINLTSQQILDKIEIHNERLPKPEFCSKKLYDMLYMCWSFNPLDRPTFRNITQILREIHPIEMKAKQAFNEKNKLEIAKDDIITILDGSNDRHWWKGQNNRTLKLGLFPRLIVDAQRRLTGEDISLPLKNSFIHTGHMGAITDTKKDKKQWGYPDKIDEIFLTNPLHPPDFFQDGFDDYNPNIHDNVMKPQMVNKVKTGVDYLTGDHSDSSYYNQSSSNENSGTSQTMDIIKPIVDNQVIQYQKNSQTVFLYENSPNAIQYESKQNFIPQKFLYENFRDTPNYESESHFLNSNIQNSKNPFISNMKLKHETQQIQKQIVDKNKFAINPNVNFDEYLNKVMNNVIEDLNKHKMPISRTSNLYKSHDNFDFKNSNSHNTNINRTIPNRSYRNYKETYF